MCIVKIHHWYARYGNNIMQIAHCCDYAFEKQNAYKIIFPSHPYFTKTEILNPTEENVCKCNTIIKNEVFFFTSEDSKDFVETWAHRKRILRTYCLSIFPETMLKELNTLLYDCCVHIRSGDTKYMNNGGYVRQPLIYYKKIIEYMLNQNKTVYILFEDDEIDVYKPLRDRFVNHERVTLSTRTTVEEDLNVLMRCKHIITSVGTFGLIPYMLSPNITDVYVSMRRSDKFNMDDDPDVKLHVVDYYAL